MSRPGLGARGYTLVEILVALAILMLGLASVLGLLYGSFQHGQLASQRDAAAVLIPEAIRQIEAEHRITETLAAAYGMPASSVGRLIETPGQAAVGDDQTPYLNVTAGGAGDPPAGTPQYLRPSGPPDSLSVWPRLTDNARVLAGLRYRVRYRLEQHPDWQPHDAAGNPTAAENPASAFQGLYLLSLVCYLAEGNDLSKWVQIGDPQVFFIGQR